MCVKAFVCVCLRESVCECVILGGQYVCVWASIYVCGVGAYLCMMAWYVYVKGMCVVAERMHMNVSVA